MVMTDALASLDVTVDERLMSLSSLGTDPLRTALTNVVNAPAIDVRADSEVWLKRDGSASSVQGGRARDTATRNKESATAFFNDFLGADKCEYGRILNMLSFEFTGIADDGSAAFPFPDIPSVVDKVDILAGVAGPDVFAARRYLIFSERGAFTRLHVDAGGSAVFYVVLVGRKDFYLLPNDDVTYRFLERSESGSDLFANMPLDKLRRVTLEAGEGLLLPSGIPHFVVTPSDSLVFGGNFLVADHLHSAARALDLEVRMNTSARHRLSSIPVAIEKLIASNLVPALPGACWDTLRNVYADNDHLQDALRDMPSQKAETKPHAAPGRPAHGPPPAPALPEPPTGR